MDDIFVCFDEALGGQEVPIAVEVGVATRTWSRREHETVIARRKCVKLALNAHTTKLLPRFHGVHSRPDIRITVQEENRRGRQIEREVRH